MSNIHCSDDGGSKLQAVFPIHQTKWTQQRKGVVGVREIELATSVQEVKYI